MGEYVAGQLVAAGLNAVAEIIEPAAYEEQFSAGYDNIADDRGWIGTNSHGNEMMDVGQTAPGYYTCTGAVSTFCDEEVTQMVTDALPLTGEERATAFMAVTAAFMEHIPVVPLVHLPNYYGVAENLTWAPRLDGFMLVKEMSLVS
jgi:ABC-type transport system substrate-binding protein